MDIVQAAILLFLIMDPLGNVPVFLALLKNLPSARQRIVLARELLIALAALLVFLVPMAIPSIAGPSTMAALLLMGHEFPGREIDWTIALFAAWVATAVILFASTHVHRWLGERALGALERLMGMLLIAISVQMLLDGVRAYLAT